MVARHTRARFEAEKCGLVRELAAFLVEDGPFMDALIFVDMTTEPAGTLNEPIEEVQRRYPADDLVYRAIVRARPLLESAIDRTNIRAGSWAGSADERARRAARRDDS